MRGAVLHKLGLNIVKERIMRRHYGVSHYREGFKHGKDPIHLKGVNAAGEVVCNDVMRWYAYKVPAPYTTLMSDADLCSAKRCPTGRPRNSPSTPSSLKQCTTRPGPSEQVLRSPCVKNRTPPNTKIRRVRSSLSWSTNDCSDSTL